MQARAQDDEIQQMHQEHEMMRMQFAQLELEENIAHMEQITQINQNHLQQENHAVHLLLNRERNMQEEMIQRSHEQNTEQEMREHRSAQILHEERQEIQSAIQTHNQSEERLSAQIRYANNYEAELQVAATRNEAYQELKKVGASSQQKTRDSWTIVREGEQASRIIAQKEMLVSEMTLA